MLTERQINHNEYEKYRKLISTQTNSWCAGYLRGVLNPKTLRVIVNRLAKTIANTKIEFDGIACSGISGVSVAGAVAIRLGKPLIIVRKNHESGNSHSMHTVEFYSMPSISHNRYIIIDDLIDTGTTVKRIVSSIEKEANFTPQREETRGKWIWRCVGVFLYEEMTSYDKVDIDDITSVPVHSIWGSAWST